MMRDKIMKIWSILKEVLFIMTFVVIAYTLYLSQLSYKETLDQNYYVRAMEHEPVIELTNDTDIVNAINNEITAKIRFDYRRYVDYVLNGGDKNNYERFIKKNVNVPIRLNFRLKNTGGNSRARLLGIIARTSLSSQTTDYLIDSIDNAISVFKPIVPGNATDFPVLRENETFIYTDTLNIEIEKARYFHLLSVYDNLYGCCYGSYSIISYRISFAIPAQEIRKIFDHPDKTHDVPIIALWNIDKPKKQRPVIFPRDKSRQFLSKVDSWSRGE